MRRMTLLERAKGNSCDPEVIMKKLRDKE